MLFVYPTLDGKDKEIPAVTHVDGTGRIQTVTRDMNPMYYEVIDEFYKQTGIPVVLNTSFNIKGEPIVNTPAETLRCFYATGIDSVAIGNYLIQK